MMIIIIIRIISRVINQFNKMNNFNNNMIKTNKIRMVIKINRLLGIIIIIKNKMMNKITNNRRIYIKVKVNNKINILPNIITFNNLNSTNNLNPNNKNTTYTIKLIKLDNKTFQ
jgi:hypothetical protein